MKVSEACVLVGLLAFILLTAGSGSAYAQEVWLTVQEDDFSGEFDPCIPNPLVGGSNCLSEAGWTIDGDPGWGVVEFQEDRRLWCAGSTGLDPATATYAPDMDAMAQFGPFDLSDALDAEISFDYFLQKEAYVEGEGGDLFEYTLVSASSPEAGTKLKQATSFGWKKIHESLSSWPNGVDLLGQAGVWLRFRFQSDAVKESGPGVLIDNVKVRKKVPVSANILYFPQFGNGRFGGVWLLSEVELMNPGEQVVTFEAELRGSNGELLALDLNGSPSAGLFQGQIQPRGTAVIRTSGNGDLLLGSAQVNAGDRIEGYLLYKGSIGEAAVLSSQRGREFMVPLEPTPGVRVGIALMGLENDASVELTLRTREGMLAARGQTAVSGNQQRARFLDEFQWSKPVDFDSFSGSLTIETTEDAAVVLLRQGMAEISTVPAVRLK